MDRWRLPRVYLPFVLITVGGPLIVMLIQGDRFQPRPAALVILAVMLVGLARGSMLAWGLFALWNLFMTLAIGVSAGGGMLVSGWLLLGFSAAGLALLFSPSMRAHVGLRRRPIAQPLG